MRLAVVMAQKVDGTWETLATPGMQAGDQKALYKELKTKNGDGKYTRAVYMESGPGSKRIKFAVPPVSAPKAKAKPKADKD